MSYLKITTFQAYLFWENIEKNLHNLSLRLSAIREKTDVIVLPEMFNSSFTLNVKHCAETMDGKTMKWMKEQARRFDCIVTGSLIIKENDKYYNRMIWMRPDGSCASYDKRHLLPIGGEEKVITPGTEKTFVRLRDWILCLGICYDLRFPVWLRNHTPEYDVLLLVANWPDSRSAHWRALIPARAIENQSFVVAVNRVGYDGNEQYYSGGSMCIDPDGNTIYYKPEDEDLYTFTIYKKDLEKTREKTPFLSSRDRFCIDY